MVKELGQISPCLVDMQEKENFGNSKLIFFISKQKKDKFKSKMEIIKTTDIYQYFEEEPLLEELMRFESRLDKAKNIDFYKIFSESRNEIFNKFLKDNNLEVKFKKIKKLLYEGNLNVAPKKSASFANVFESRVKGLVKSLGKKILEMEKETDENVSKIKIIEKLNELKNIIKKEKIKFYDEVHHN